VTPIKVKYELKQIPHSSKQFEEVKEKRNEANPTYNF